MSMLAVQYLFTRFSYSMVWCNRVNCLGVEDQVLGARLRLPVSEFYVGRLDQHRCDEKNRELAIITKQGKYEGDSDGGEGSPHIR